MRIALVMALAASAGFSTAARAQKAAGPAPALVREVGEAELVAAIRRALGGERSPLDLLLANGAGAGRPNVEAPGERTRRIMRSCSPLLPTGLWACPAILASEPKARGPAAKATRSRPRLS